MPRNTLLTRISRVHPTDDQHRVTTLELFFDLVFVFAVTQVGNYVVHHFGPPSIARGLLVLALLWFTWSSFTWLGNQGRADRGAIRVAVMGAMVLMLLVGVAIPAVWDSHGDLPGGVAPALVFAVCLGAVRILHLAVYGLAAGQDRALRRQVLRASVPVGVAVTLLIAGSLLPGTGQAVLWTIALIVDYGGVYLSGADWRLTAPGHFAERHGLVVIIAIGETVVAVGTVAVGGVFDAELILGLLLSGVVCVCMWWTYFDAVAPQAEHALLRREGTERVKVARDGFSYMHFPLVAGIIFTALGIKQLIASVVDPHGHDFSTAARLTLFLSVACYLLSDLVFRLRSRSPLNKPRLVSAAVLVVCAFVTGGLGAVACLAVLVAVLLITLVLEDVFPADDLSTATT
ncbi:low temperature requirement protein A [Myceligenerans halotolerans]